MTTRRVFLFEYLSASRGGHSDAAAAELRAEGIAMRDALMTDLVAVPGLHLRVASERPDESCKAPAETVCSLAGETMPEFIARQALLHDLVWVVAPETAGVLEALHRVVPVHQWIGCTGEAIRLASSKRATLARLHSHGIATPLDFLADASVQHWVVKPDDGAGSLQTHRHVDRAAAMSDRLQREDRGEPAVIEPWVDGDAMSLSLLAHDERAELLAVNRQRLSIDAGGSVSLVDLDIAVSDITAADRAALEQMARAVCAAIPGLSGWVGVDLVWHAGRGPVVIEVNPRVTSACVGMSTALGRNLAAEILAAHVSTHSSSARTHVSC
jgi:predicted ATP-grasp superfamily ATP-dependent carboligase